MNKLPDLKIFIASSIDDFKAERYLFARIAHLLEKPLRSRGIKLDLILCEALHKEYCKGKIQNLINDFYVSSADIVLLLADKEIKSITKQEIAAAKKHKRLIVPFFRNVDNVTVAMENLGLSTLQYETFNTTDELEVKFYIFIQQFLKNSADYNFIFEKSPLFYLRKGELCIDGKSLIKLDKHNITSDLPYSDEHPSPPDLNETTLKYCFLWNAYTADMMNEFYMDLLRVKSDVTEAYLDIDCFFDLSTEYIIKEDYKKVFIIHNDPSALTNVSEIEKIHAAKPDVFVFVPYLYDENEFKDIINLLNSKNIRRYFITFKTLSKITWELTASVTHERILLRDEKAKLQDKQKHKLRFHKAAWDENRKKYFDTKNPKFAIDALLDIDIVLDCLLELQRTTEETQYLFEYYGYVVQKGKFYIDLGDPIRCLGCYDQALKKLTEEHELWLNCDSNGRTPLYCLFDNIGSCITRFINVLVKCKDYLSSISFLEIDTEDEPSIKTALLKKAEIFISMSGDIMSVEKAINLNNYGNALMESNQYDKAFQAFSMAINLYILISEPGQYFTNHRRRCLIPHMSLAKNNMGVCCLKKAACTDGVKEKLSELNNGIKWLNSVYEDVTHGESRDSAINTMQWRDYCIQQATDLLYNEYNTSNEETFRALLGDCNESLLAGIIIYLNECGSHFSQESNWKVALEHYKFNYDIVKTLPYGTLPDIELVKSTINVAKIYACIGDNVPEAKEDCYRNALKYYDQAKKYAENTVETTGADLLGNIYDARMCVFYNLQDFQRAYESGEKSLEIWKKLSNEENIKWSEEQLNALKPLLSKKDGSENE